MLNGIEQAAFPTKMHDKFFSRMESIRCCTFNFLLAVLCNFAYIVLFFVIKWKFLIGSRFQFFNWIKVVVLEFGWDKFMFYF